MRFACVLRLCVNAFADSDGKRSYTQLNAPVRTSVFCIATPCYICCYLASVKLNETWLHAVGTHTHKHCV